MKTIISAPAKINLTLDILDKRSDNYHNVKMIMQSVNLCDIVTLTENNSGEITVDCTDSRIPADGSNIVCKAAKAFYAKIDEICRGLHISIEKNIPVEAGLAGGSADGAAVLVGLNMLFGCPFEESVLEEIGAAVGADVPFCIGGGTALAEGTGTELTKLDDLARCFILLVKPPVGISTALAYKQADERTFIPECSTDKLLPLPEDITEIADKLHNDFESVVTVDCIEEIKQSMLDGGALGACMSGSGPSVYGIFDDALKAASCADILKTDYAEVFLTEPLKHGCKVICEKLE